MPGEDLPFIVILRFSYPALAGFRRLQAQVEDTEALLYEPARLERRFALFETLTLPSLLAQTDGDFTTLFVTGQTLPPAARARLHRAAARLPGAEVVALPPMHAYEAVRAALETLPWHGASHTVTLRLDDDDALDVGFMARLRNCVARLLPLQEGDAPLAVAYNRGCMVDLSGPRPAFNPVVERLPLGCGTALIAPAGHPDNIYRRNHRWLPQFVDTFSEARTLSWLRSVHGDNDSDGAAVGRRLSVPPRVLAAELAEAFPFLPDDWLDAAAAG